MMKFGIYIGLFLAVVVCLSGCKSSKRTRISFNDLDGDWNVVAMNGKTLDPAQTGQFVGIDVATKRLSGNAGCNRMMGQIEYDEAHKQIIKFPHIATTRMACPDMSGEREMLETLGKVVRFEAVGDTKPVREIAFYGIDNTELMVLRKKE